MAGEAKKVCCEYRQVGRILLQQPWSRVLIPEGSAGKKGELRTSDVGFCLPVGLSFHCQAMKPLGWVSGKAG